MNTSGQGFTLIEVLVAIAMLSIIAVGVSGMLIGILRITGRSQSEQSLGYVAQDYMEGVRKNWTACTTSGTPTSCGYPAYDAATLPALPTSLPTGITCTAAALPSTASTTAAPIRSREVTLSCAGSGPAQSYSLVVTPP